MIYKRVIANPSEFSFEPTRLGECTVDNPLSTTYVPDDAKISFSSDVQEIAELSKTPETFPAYTEAGPREKIFHNPAWTKAAIVTCGGLCPGLNDVIKGVVETLWFDYGVRNILGIPFGYKGLAPKSGLEPRPLNPDIVDSIHARGGTILGSSRGQQSTCEICDTLQRLNINMLFCIGGDGTLRGAGEIAKELIARKQNISVIGVPKTIDNDLNFVGRTFGFETAVNATSPIITSAHVEGNGTPNGIGLVKLMGRDSGFISAYATLANAVVNFCLIPEDPFELYGEHGLLRALERRFAMGKSHALIVVAEGAGQHLFKDVKKTKDASGNVLKQDIGELLKSEITSHFAKKEMECSVKYFDPSYSIRSVPATGTDAIFCLMLAQNAVHCAMAGFTNMVVGLWGRHFNCVPIPLATAERNKVDLDGPLWKSVLTTTQQKEYFQV